MKKTVVFIENNVEFLKMGSRALERNGYAVFQAGTIDAAQSLLEEKNIHAAIVDIHMQNDNDEKDISGLLLAKDHRYRPLPKVILTISEDYQFTREAMAPNAEGVSPVIDYINKKEGMDALLESLEKIFYSHVRIHTPLEVIWQAATPLSLASVLSGEQREDIILERSKELHDLIRRTFHHQKQVRIARLLWNQPDRLALGAVAFSEQNLEKHFLIVCGSREAVAHERDQFKRYAPSAAANGGTFLDLHTESIHFGALVYSLADADVMEARTLHDFVQNASEAEIREALNALFNIHLPSWHLNQRQTGLETMGEVLGVDIRYVDLAEKIKGILVRLPEVAKQITVKDGSLQIQFGGKTREISLLDADQFYRIQSFPLGLTQVCPGFKDVHSILVGEGNSLWFTSFLGAGRHSELHPYVLLEARLRYDWVSVEEFWRLYEMEERLIFGELSNPDPSDLSMRVRKTVRIIKEIRQHILPRLHEDWLPYLASLFYQTVHRIYRFDRNTLLAQSEMVRFAHLVVSAALLAHKITKQIPVRRKNIIHIENGQVYVRGVIKKVSGRGFEILAYLHKHSGRLVPRNELAKVLFGVDEENHDVRNSINTEISRLRRKIEPDVKSPRFLITVVGQGYILKTEENGP